MPPKKQGKPSTAPDVHEETREVATEQQLTVPMAADEDINSIYREGRVRRPPTEVESQTAVAKFTSVDWIAFDTLLRFIDAGMDSGLWERYLSTEEGPDSVSQFRQWAGEFRQIKASTADLFRAAIEIQTKADLAQLALAETEFVIEIVAAYERINDVIDKWQSTIEDFLSQLPSHSDPPLEAQDLQVIPINAEQTEESRNTIAARIGALLSERVQGRSARQEILEEVATRAIQIELLQQLLRSSVDGARAQGASWNEIGRAAGTTPQAAHRRWNEGARKWHREYVRGRYRPADKRRDEQG